MRVSLLASVLALPIASCSTSSNQCSPPYAGCATFAPTAAIHHADGRPFAIGDKYEFVFPDASPMACDASDCDGGVGPASVTCSIEGDGGGRLVANCSPLNSLESQSPFVTMHDPSTIFASVGNAFAFRIVVKDGTGHVLASTTAHTTSADDGCCGTMVPGDVTIP